jgi:hypothetical protein
MRAGTRYNIVRPHKYHLIGLGVVDGTGAYEDAVHWSDAADPGKIPQTWVPADDNEAGDNVLADETGKIVDGLSLRDSFFIYKQDAVYEMSYIGGNEVYRFNKVFSSTGALSKHCIARVKGTHVVLGAGDVYQHDGQNYRSLAEGRVRDAIFGVIDNENFTNAFVAYLESDDKVWICFPRQGSTWPDVALIWDPATDAFGIRDIKPCSHMASGVVGPAVVGEDGDWDSDGEAWDDDTTIWLQETLKQSDDSLAMADPVNTRFYVANTGATADGDSYTSGGTVTGLDLGDPSLLKGVRRIYPRIRGGQGATFNLRVLGQDTPGASFRSSPTYTFMLQDIENSGVAVDMNARYIGLTMSTEDNQAWDITGFDVHYLPRGLF